MDIKIAIIGAGITGVTAAAHCVGHGFDVVIFEKGGRDSLGGIWSASQLPVYAGSSTRLTNSLRRRSMKLQVSRSIR